MRVEQTQAESRFTDALGDLGAELGLNRVVAKIYALLYLRQETLSLEALAEELQVSKATISINIRELERWEAVRRVWVDGSRKGFYVANPDVVGVILSALGEGFRRRLSRLEGELGQIRSSPPASGDGTEDFLGARVGEVEKILELCHQGLNVLDRPSPKNLIQLATMFRRRPGNRWDPQDEPEKEVG